MPKHGETTYFHTFVLVQVTGDVLVKEGQKRGSTHGPPPQSSNVRDALSAALRQQRWRLPSVDDEQSSLASRSFAMNF